VECLIDKLLDVVRFLSRKRTDAVFLASVDQLSGPVYRRKILAAAANVPGFEHFSCNCSACPQRHLSASVVAQLELLPQSI
jgi:hypothetical protein